MREAPWVEKTETPLTGFSGVDTGMESLLAGFSNSNRHNRSIFKLFRQNIYQPRVASKAATFQTVNDVKSKSDVGSYCLSSVCIPSERGHPHNAGGELQVWEMSPLVRSQRSS